MTAYEKDLLYMLCSGDTVTAMSKYTGEYFTGAVDEVAALQGKFWIYAELGERKLIDLDEHTICKIN
ncbi:hypothetical protein [Paenarthrobacter sp. NCHU4564]|uniref:hypothetical protein n=1 Tax=Paenarthrobacter sp. NCHU4564 TaxID=3451353 RepID=UPI003F9559AC